MPILSKGRLKKLDSIHRLRRFKDSRGVAQARPGGRRGQTTDSHYEPGERSGAWIKLRTNLEQEFVIGGYIPGARGFDVLLVGVYEKKDLMFVAKVKNGFVSRIRDDHFPTLKALQTAQCPFKNLPGKRTSR